MFDNEAKMIGEMRRHVMVMRVCDVLVRDRVQEMAHTGRCKHRTITRLRLVEFSRWQRAEQIAAELRMVRRLEQLIGMGERGMSKYDGEENVTRSAENILLDAAAIQRERGKQYDAAGGRERSMGRIVAIFNTLYGTNLTEYQGWKFMEILKMVRGAQKPHEDSEVDCVSYAALAAEARLAEPLREGTGNSTTI